MITAVHTMTSDDNKINVSLYCREKEVLLKINDKEEGKTLEFFIKPQDIKEIKTILTEAEHYLSVHT